jgi:sirohydrochlorin cobaltochelatase
MKAVIFFGHGARDIRWREPFDRLGSLWSAQNNGIPVELAFLELMAPSLQEAVSSLVQKGVTNITVIPVFFGQGGHLRNDFPLLLAEAQKSHPGVKFSVSPAVGEDLGVLNSIISFSVNNLEN